MSYGQPPIVLRPLLVKKLTNMTCAYAEHLTYSLVEVGYRSLDEQEDGTMEQIITRAHTFDLGEGQGEFVTEWLKAADFNDYLNLLQEQSNDEG